MTKKLSFTKQDELHSAKFISVKNDSNLTKMVFFKTIEIRGVNPSELTMIIEKSLPLGQRKIEEIPLVDLHYLITFKNDIYILDATAAEEFYDVVNHFSVRVGFRAINQDTPIDIDVFYSMIESDDYPETVQKAMQKHRKIYEEQELK